MKIEDKNKLLLELDRYNKANYSNGKLDTRKLNLCLDIYRKFSGSRKDAIKLLLTNEYGIIGNLMYKFVISPDEEVMDFMMERDKKAILDGYKIHGRRIISENDLAGSITEMIWLLNYDISCIDSISYQLKKSDELYLEIARISPNLLELFKDKKSKELIIKCIKTNPQCFQYLPDEYKKNEDVVLELVNCDGRQLLYSHRHQNNEEIVYNAIKNNGMALEAVSPKFKDNKELVELAVSNSPWALQYASDRLKDDEAIVILAILSNGSSLLYASNRIKDIKEFALKAVDNNPFAFSFVSERLKDDYDVAFLAVSKEKTMYKYMSERLKTLIGRNI